MAGLSAELKVRLDDETKAELERCAVRLDRPPSSLARTAIRYYLAHLRETEEAFRRAR